MCSLEQKNLHLGCGQSLACEIHEPMLHWIARADPGLDTRGLTGVRPSNINDPAFLDVRSESRAVQLNSDMLVSFTGRADK